MHLYVSVCGNRGVVCVCGWEWGGGVGEEERGQEEPQDGGDNVDTSSRVSQRILVA